MGGNPVRNCKVKQLLKQEGVIERLPGSSTTNAKKQAMRKLIFVVGLLLAFPLTVAAQSVDEDQLGAWYMYFYNAKFGDGPWGYQGDAQFRFWNAGSDLEQILIRNGLTYTPKDAGIMFTLGYASITTGVPGESTKTSHENRIYQEALFSQKIGSRFLFTHRVRYEQRFVEGQDFRTRYRYNMFLNVPLNNTDLSKKTFYLALYNEIFLNGQRDIGDGRAVQTFDRNRTYLGLGYVLSPTIRLQAGWMAQTTTAWSKNQFQLSFHHNYRW